MHLKFLKIKKTKKKNFSKGLLKIGFNFDLSKVYNKHFLKTSNLTL